MSKNTSLINLIGIVHEKFAVYGLTRLLDYIHDSTIAAASGRPHTKASFVYWCSKYKVIYEVKQSVAKLPVIYMVW